MIKVADPLLKIEARKITLDEIREYNFYHAVWANFSLLNMTKNQFSDILKTIFCTQGRGAFFSVLSEE